MSKKKTKSSTKASAAKPAQPVVPEPSDIRLVEGYCKVGASMKPNELPTKAKQLVELVLAIQDTSGQEERSPIMVRVLVTNQIAFDYTGEFDNPEKEYPLMMMSRYGVTFRGVDPDLDEELITDAAVHAAYPFWRHFAQDMTTRMGLPVFPMRYPGKLPPLKTLGSMKAGEVKLNESQAQTNEGKKHKTATGRT